MRLILDLGPTLKEQMQAAQAALQDGTMKKGDLVGVKINEHYYSVKHNATSIRVKPSW